MRAACRDGRVGVQGMDEEDLGSVTAVKLSYNIGTRQEEPPTDARGIMSAMYKMWM